MKIKKDTIINDNPGFAPEWKKHSWTDTNPNMEGYACVTGLFNEDYWDVHKDDTDANDNKKYAEYYYHEGVDFRGSKDTPVYSFIEGIVIDVGTHKNAHDGTGMGDYMIVQDVKDVNKYYLLVHLSWTSWETYGIKAGSKICPGQIVAGVGTQEYAVRYHLHVSVIVLNPGEEAIDKIIILNGNKITKLGVIRDANYRFPIWDHTNRSKMRNPFNHTESWGGRR